MGAARRVALVLSLVAAAAGCGRSGPPGDGNGLPAGMLRVDPVVGLGVVTSDPPGISCGSNLVSCEFQFDPGETVTLFASNDASVPFDRWSDACEHADDVPECELTLGGGREVGAHFRHRLRVTIVGTANVVSLPDPEIDCSQAGGACESFYDPGATGPRLTATTPIGRTLLWRGECALQAPDTCDADVLTEPRDVEVLSLEAGDAVWAISFGSDGNERGLGIAVDADGNPAVVGEFDTTLDFGEGPVTPVGRAAFAVSLEKTTGSPRWSARMDGQDEDRAWGVAATSGGGLSIVGEFDSTTLDLDGQRTLGNATGEDDGWHVSISASDAVVRDLVSLTRNPADELFAVAGDGAGNVFCAGEIDTGGGNAQARWISDAGAVNTRDFGGGEVDSFLAVAATPEGDGVFGGAVTSVTVTIPVIGSITLLSNGGVDAFLMKEDPTLSGDVIFAKSYGGAGEDYVYGVAMDPSGATLYAIGTIDGATPIEFDMQTAQGNGQSDVFVSRHDAADGDTIWVESFGGSLADQGFGIAEGAGGVAIIGTFTGPMSFGGTPFAGFGGSDIFVAKLSTNGSVVWAREFGSDQDDFGTGVAIDADGFVVATGYIRGPVDFGFGPLPHGGGSDVFVVRLAP